MLNSQILYSSKFTKYNQKIPVSTKKECSIVAPLCIVNDVICCTYCPSPASDSVTVPLVPPSLCQQSLQETYDIPRAGYQGYFKTLSRLQHQHIGLVWCNKCQMSKLPSPTWAPLQNVPIDNLWEMLAIDI